MKLNFFLFFVLCVPFCGKTQTNTFPTNGSVGIGTTTPKDKLEVVGGFLTSGNSSFGQFNTQSPKGYVNFGGDNHGSLIVGSNLFIDNSVELGTNMRIANTHPTVAGAGILMPGNGQYFQGSIIFHATEPEPVPQPSPVPVFPIVPALKGAPRVPTGILAPVFNRIMQFMVPIFVPPTYYINNGLQQDNES